ncbi:MAG: PTS glucose transporter subunit IIA [Solobacterium sp.]|nr:PTS glucose transporter subunit IIA [Solobacterium sp.]
MFNLFGKKKEELPAINVSDTDIVALADGKMIDVTTVSDPVFAQKMMGDSVAFTFDSDKVTLCSPANGTLSVMFPTGHSFGIKRNDGVELLVHCGINTVEAKGDGFKTLKKQGDTIKAGDPVVEVDVKKLSSKYDMSTMLIITNANGKTIAFKEPKDVKRGEIISL